MKKIVTLIFCTAVLSSAFAQRDDGNWNNKNNNSVVYNNDNQRGQHYDNDRYDNQRNNDNRGYQDARFIQYQKQQQLQKIDQQYNYQEQQVMNNWSMSRRQKRYAIANLQAQRAQQIDNINRQNGYNNVYNNNRNNYDRYDHDHDGR